MGLTISRAVQHGESAGPSPSSARFSPSSVATRRIGARPSGLFHHRRAVSARAVAAYCKTDDIKLIAQPTGLLELGHKTLPKKICTMIIGTPNASKSRKPPNTTAITLGQFPSHQISPWTAFSTKRPAITDTRLGLVITLRPSRRQLLDRPVGAAATALRRLDRGFPASVAADDRVPQRAPPRVRRGGANQEAPSSVRVAESLPDRIARQMVDFDVPASSAASRRLKTAIAPCPVEWFGRRCGEHG